MLRWVKVYMTGLWIVIALITFICVSRYRCRIYSIQFWRLFYWMPQAILLIYLWGAYVSFVLNVWLFPTSGAEFLMLISPYGYRFHFIGIILGFCVALRLFFNNIKRLENKKLYSDVIFFSLTASLIPLGLFLLLWDNFIGKSTDGPRWVQALHTESALNKFSSVYPIGLFLSMGMAILYAAMAVRKYLTKKIGVGMIGFVYMLIIINICLLYQQYPRYWVIPFGTHTLDIKQYVSFFIVILALAIYTNRKKNKL